MNNYHFLFTYPQECKNPLEFIVLIMFFGKKQNQTNNMC